MRRRATKNPRLDLSALDFPGTVRGAEARLPFLERSNGTIAMKAVNGGGGAPDLPGDWRNLVVFCASTPWDGTAPTSTSRSGSPAGRRSCTSIRHLLRGLARRHRESAPALEGPRLRLLGERLAG